MASYCGKCGRKLEDGEVCTCQQQNPEDRVFEQPQGADRTPAGTAAQTFGKMLSGAQKALKDAGRQMPRDSKGFGEFFNGMKNKLGFGTPESNSTGVYERNLKIVPECIDTNENEVPVKQYNIALLRSRMRFMRAEGRLQVTNKRVIFRASGRSLTGKTTQQQEFELDHIRGIEMRKDYRFSLLNFFLAAVVASPVTYLAFALVQSMGRPKFLMGLVVFLLGLAAIIPFFTLYKKFWLKLITSAFSVTLFGAYYQVASMYGRYYRGGVGFFGGLALVLAILTGLCAVISWMMVCWLPNLIIAVKTEGTVTTSGAVLIRRKPSFLECLFRRVNGGEEYSGFAEVMPWVDTDVAIDELGAMIDDLQKLGDYGVQKWKLPE